MGCCVSRADRTKRRLCWWCWLWPCCLLHSAHVMSTSRVLTNPLQCCFIMMMRLACDCANSSVVILTPGCYCVDLSIKHVGWDEAPNPMASSVTEVLTMMVTGSRWCWLRVLLCCPFSQACRLGWGSQTHGLVRHRGVWLWWWLVQDDADSCVAVLSFQPSTWGRRRPPTSTWSHPSPRRRSPPTRCRSTWE